MSVSKLSYWQYYGLLFEPFVGKKTETSLYIYPRFEHCLRLLLHLSQIESSLQLVTGLTGTGKTTLLDAFFRLIKKKAGVCKLQANAAINVSVLEELLARYLGLRLDKNLDYFDSLRCKIEQLRQRKARFYVLVDDAHKLPLDALAFFLKVMQLQASGEVVLHCVLFGGIQLNALYADLTADYFTEELVHTLRLEPFTDEESKAYITHCLTAAGWQHIFPFSDLQFQQLHAVSHGIPLKINQLARQYLQKRYLTEKQVSFARFALPDFREIFPRCIHFFSKKYLTLLAIGVPILLLILFFMQNTKVPEKQGKQSATVYSLSLPKMGGDTAVFSEEHPIVLAKQEINENSVALTKKIGHNDEDHILQKKSVTVNVPAQSTFGQPSKGPSTQILTEADLQTVNQTTLKLLAKTAKQKPAAVFASTEKVSVDSPDVKQRRHAAALIKQPQHYTIQLAAARDRAILQRTFSTVPLSQPVFYVETSVKGQYWWVALYGDYANRTLAAQALQKLPSLLQGQHPWIRQYQSLQLL